VLIDPMNVILTQLKNVATLLLKGIFINELMSLIK